MHNSMLSARVILQKIRYTVDYDLICYRKHTLGGVFWDPFLAAILTECKISDPFSYLEHSGSEYRDRLYEVRSGIFIGCRKNGFEIKVQENNLPAIQELFSGIITGETTSSVPTADGGQICYHTFMYPVKQDAACDVEDRVQIGKEIIQRIESRIS